MSIRFVSVKCPDCGATLDIEEGRRQIFCSYCGAKVIVENDNEYIYRHIDDAGVKKAETDRMIKMKKIEMLEKQRQAEERERPIKIKLALAFGVIGIIAFGVSGYMDSIWGLDVGMFSMLTAMLIAISASRHRADEIEEELLSDDKIKIPKSIDDFKKKSYATIEAAFISSGFTNVKCVPLNDLTFGLTKKSGLVASVSVNGKEIEYGGKKMFSGCKGCYFLS